MRSEVWGWFWTALIAIGGIAITVLYVVQGAPLLITVLTGGALTVCAVGYLSLKIIGNRSGGSPIAGSDEGGDDLPG